MLLHLRCRPVPESSNFHISRKPISIASKPSSSQRGETSDQLSAEARGDLNNDKLKIGLVSYVTHLRTIPNLSTLLTTAVPEGGYRLAEKTQKAEIPGMGCCWLEDLTIRRGSIFIQNNAKTAATMEAATHQFKLAQRRVALGRCANLPD